MLVITISLWVVAAICFALAVLLPFTTINTTRMNWVALGLLYAALTHIFPWK